MGKVIEMCQMAEPGPRQWVVQDLIPEGAVTILYGDGGVGKSNLGAYLGTLVSLGEPFGDLPSDKRRVLYIDTELDADEFARRTYKIARGLGLQKPPEGL